MTIATLMKINDIRGMAGAAELKDFTWLNDDNATGGAASNIRDVDTWEDDSESAESDVSDLRLDNTDVPESDMATAAEVNKSRCNRHGQPSFESAHADRHVASTSQERIAVRFETRYEELENKSPEKLDQRCIHIHVSQSSTL